MSMARAGTQQMSNVDRMWLRMDDPTNLMMITGVTLFDQPVERSAIEELMRSRLLTIPRFSQKVSTPSHGNRHKWVPDPDLDLGWHVQEVALAEPGDDLGLRQFVNAWISQPLDLDRPLWQVHLIQNYKGGSALLWRLHHCVGDGMALMLVLLSLTDLEPEQAGREANPLSALFGEDPPGREVAKQHLESILPQAVKLLTLPAETMRGLSRWKKGGASVPALGRLVFRPPDQKTLFRGALGVPKRVAWTPALAMQDIARIREGLGGTVNDILTNAVSGGLRRYLEARGELRNRLNVRAVVPVNLRPLEEMSSLGNQFGLIFVSLPLGVADTRHRLAEVSRRMSRLKRSFEPVVAMKIMAALGLSPPMIQELVVRIFGTKGTAVLTNVPGPTQKLYLAGKPMTGFMFWVPQSARLGMGISISSYHDNVRIGVVTDAGLVPDPEELAAGMEKEFQTMLRLAEESLRRAS